MDKRVEMLNCVTGTVMLVPLELVAMYEKAGHKIVRPQTEEKPKPKGKK